MLDREPAPPVRTATGDEAGSLRAADVYRELVPGHELINALARTERVRLAHAVAFLFTSPTILNERHPLFVPLLQAARTRASHLGMDVLELAPSPADEVDEATLARALAIEVAGLVVFGGTHKNASTLRERWPTLPTVFVESDVFGPRSAHVAMDNERAFHDVVAHLASSGRTRIATITGRIDGRPGVERLRGYERALQARGLPLERELVQHGDWTPDSGYELMKRLLALTDLPDAVAAACDVQAVGALVALEEAGLRCPEDIALSGFDDAPFAARLSPSLTSVRQPASEMGIAAIDLLVSLIDDSSRRAPYVLRSGELVVRESSAPRA